MKKHMQGLSKMNEDQLQTYLKLTNPDNAFMKTIKFGGNEGLAQLQQKQIWASIIQKYEKNKDD